MKKRRVAIILFNDNEGNILLQNRKNYNKYGEEFGFFGGAIEEGETPEEALKREIKEEFGFEIKDFTLFKHWNKFYKDFGKEVERFLFIAPMPDIQSLKCGEGEIFTINFKDSFNLKMAPGDVKSLKEIYEYLKSKK